ncbi:MAG TPA: phosphatidate cytidylyltransferase [Moorella mulderi]|nr:phosphatidate cytidylyltransferase [Moorella mulderi]
MLARFLVALAGIPIILLVAYLGSWYLLAFLLILVSVALHEFFNLCLYCRLRPLSGIGLAAALLTLIFVFFHQSLPTWFFPLLLAALFLLFLALFPMYSMADVAITFLGICYIGGFLSHLLMLRFLPGGASLLIFTFLLTWAYDTGAFFSGRFWGRTHPWLHLSPRKTWAGVVGGGLLTLGVAAVLGPHFLNAVSLGQLLVLGGVAAIAAQCGDLVISALKRQAGVKDTGNILPGHGGILDRFDSLLLVAPVLYYYLAFILIRSGGSGLF